MAIIDWVRSAYHRVAKPLMRGAHNIRKSGYGMLRGALEHIPYIGTAASVANTVIDHLADAHEYTESAAGREKMQKWGLEEKSAPRPARPRMPGGFDSMET